MIQTEQACLQWLEEEERVDAPNQKLEDLWSIPLPLERRELRVREWNRYIRKYRRSLKLVEDCNEASEIRHLLKDVLPGHWKRRVEDEEKKRAKKRVAVRIMASEDTHARIMEFFWRNLGEPSRMFGLKNVVYVEVFGDTMGQRLMRLNNVEWWASCSSRDRSRRKIKYQENDAPPEEIKRKIVFSDLRNPPNNFTPLFG